MTERFASPLNFNLTTRCYFSLYPEDRLFGANIDAYSCKCQGASEVHPEHEPAENKFKWQNPMQWADGVEYIGHPKTNIRIFIVANTAGLCQSVNQDELNNALGQASANSIIHLYNTHVFFTCSSFRPHISLATISTTSSLHSGYCEPTWAYIGMLETDEACAICK